MRNTPLGAPAVGRCMIKSIQGRIMTVTYTKPRQRAICVPAIRQHAGTAGRYEGLGSAPHRTSSRASSHVPTCPRLCLEVRAASSGRHRQTTPSDEPDGRSQGSCVSV